MVSKKGWKTGRKGDSGLLHPTEPMLGWNTPFIISILRVFVQLHLSYRREKKIPMVFHWHQNVNAHQDAYHSPTSSTKYSLHLPIFYLSIEGTPSWSLAGDSSTTKPGQPQTEVLPIKLNTSGDLQNKVGTQPWLLGHPLTAPLLLTLLVRTQGLLLVINCTIPKRIMGSEVS